MKKSPFIQGFKQPTLSSNSYFLLSDVRGNGQGNLVIWAQDRSQLIVYKGSNRDVEKSSKIKNVNCIIDYYDEESNTMPAIALAAENALYIFRGLVQSFRLKIPDVIAQVQQQLMWSKFMDNPTQLAAELANIKSSFLSQKAKYYLGASSDERRKEIIETVFQQGISQKDSISAISVIKQTDNTGIGNIVIGTELNRLYILDNFGHKILHERVIDFAPCMIFAYGKMETKYVIICVSRQGTISIYLNTDKNDPSESIRLNTWITTADLSYPQFAIATSDQVVSLFSFSNSNLKISVPKYSYKVSQKPLKVLWMKKKGIKLLIIGFQNQFRIMRQKQIIYRYQTDFKLSSFLYGSFARQQSCLVLLYQNKGFEVLIGHRLFNPKENYQTRKIGNIQQPQVQNDAIDIPKKTSHFLKYMNSQPDTLQQFKMFQRSMKLLKWSTLKGKISQKISSTTKIQINPKILGLGPIFIIKLQIENISNQPIFNIKIIINQQNDLISLIKYPQTINMLPPFIPTLKQIELKSISLKPQRFKIDLCWKGNLASTIVCLPACQQMAD